MFKHKKTQLMGILNTTPDSFYDRGQWFEFESALQRGIQISQEGADWIDVGGESTRPGSASIDVAEELKRVIPIIKALKQCIITPISIDTSKPAVAEAAIEAGATLINDVQGFRCATMRQIVAEASLPICVMHMHETPLTMQNNPQYIQGIIPFLIDWFKNQIELLLSAGVKTHNIILDPGIGFGKITSDNLQIMHNLAAIKALGFPILIGLSRKSFLSKINHQHSTNLLAATLAMNSVAIMAGIDIIRVHDIAVHRDVIDTLDCFIEQNFT